MERRIAIGETLKTNGFESIVAFLFASRCIYYVWLAFASNFYSPLYYYLTLVIRYSSALLGLIYLMFTGKTRFSSFIYLAPLLIYFVFLVVHTYGGYNFNYLDEVLAIGCFLLMSPLMKKKILWYFFKIVVVTSAIGIVLYVLYYSNVPIGFVDVPFNSGSDSSVTHDPYHKWFIFALIGDRRYSLVRLCGIFNEPGALATVCAFLFAIMYKTATKFEKIVLLISIVLSFSVAGYLLAFLFLCYYMIRQRKIYILLVLVFLIFFLAAPHINWGNSFLNQFFSRFEITSSGLAGDNRTNQEFDNQFNELINSNYVFFGYGARYSTNTGSSTYKMYIFQFGIIGFAVYILAWLFASIKSASRNIDCYVFLFLFFLSVYQRPVTISNSYGYLIAFGGIEWIKTYGMTRPIKTKNTESGNCTLRLVR